MKYLHIMDDHYFTRKFIEVINSKLDPHEHLFLLVNHPAASTINAIKTGQLTNVVIPFLRKGISNLISRRKQKFFDYFRINGNFRIICYKLIRFFKILQVLLPDVFLFKFNTKISETFKITSQLIQNANKIFIHCLNVESIRLLSGIQKRKSSLFWIVWGIDLYNNIPLELFDPETKNLLSTIQNRSTKKRFKNAYESLFFLINKYITDIMRRRVISKFDYILTSTMAKGDYNYIKMFFKTKAVHNSEFNYPEIVDFQHLTCTELPSNDTYKFKTKFEKLVQVGNSGDPTNNHLDILFLLSKVDVQDFGIICPLSYSGIPGYVKEIVKIGRSLFGERFIPLLDFLEAKTYFQILNQVDVAIMNHNRQQGAGNVLILLYLMKKIYMKKTSVFNVLKDNEALVFSIENLKDEISQGIDIFEYPYTLEINKRKAEELAGQARTNKQLQDLFS